MDRTDYRRPPIEESSYTLEDIGTGGRGKIRKLSSRKKLGFLRLELRSPHPASNTVCLVVAFGQRWLVTLPEDDQAFYGDQEVLFENRVSDLGEEHGDILYAARQFWETPYERSDRSIFASQLGMVEAAWKTSGAGEKWGYQLVVKAYPFAEEQGRCHQPHPVPGVVSVEVECGLSSLSSDGL